MLEGLRKRVDEAHRRLGIGRPGGLGLKALKALAKLREHLSRLERESYFAALAVAVAVFSGQPPVKAFEALKDMDSLPHARLEVGRIIRDAQLSQRFLGEQLAHEAREARGVWGKLLSTIVTVEASGLDPRQAMSDMLRLVLRDMRTDYEQLARRFQTRISSASVLFGALPMMVATMLAVLASENVVPMLLGFTVANMFLAFLWLLSVDLQVPEIAEYKPFYKRILLKWLPLGLAVGLAIYLGLLVVPLSLVSAKALALAAGTLAFTLPAALEWRLQARAMDELLETLPLVLRDVAEQVERGFSVHQALENIAAAGGLPKYTQRLLSLLVKEARVRGSLRDAYCKLKSLLPHPWRISLEILSLAEEMGAGSAALHSLADAMMEYTLTLREFRRSTQSYKWFTLAMTALTLGLMAVIANTVMPKLALAGLAAQRAQGLVSLPFTPPTPEQLPVMKDLIYLAIAANSLTLAAVTGKTTGWRIGDSLPLLAETSTLILLALTAGYWIL